MNDKDIAALGAKGLPRVSTCWAQDCLDVRAPRQDRLHLVIVRGHLTRSSVDLHCVVHVVALLSCLLRSLQGFNYLHAHLFILVLQWVRLVVSDLRSFLHL